MDWVAVVAGVVSAGGVVDGTGGGTDEELGVVAATSLEVGEVGAGGATEVSTVAVPVVLLSVTVESVPLQSTVTVCCSVVVMVIVLGAQVGLLEMDEVW